MRLRTLVTLAAVAAVAPALGAQTPAPRPDSTPILLLPSRVFDGTEIHEGWAVLVRGERIVAAGPVAGIASPTGVRRMDLAGTTLMPGMIEGHSHLLLHPYNETPWDDQVLREPLALRVAPARRCAPASPRRAISVQKAQVTPTSGSSARSRRGSSPVRA